MTDTQPTYLELWPESFGEKGATANFRCPVDPCEYGIEVSELAANDEPLRLLVSPDPVPNPHPVESIRTDLQNAAALMFMHCDQRHTAADWMLATQASEEHWESVLGDQNHETDRAWAAVRSAQESLQRVQDELRDLRLAVSEADGARARGEHVYLSTSCFHEDHDYCRSETGHCGSKTPAQCKFCAAPCRCSCHETPKETP